MLFVPSIQPITASQTYTLRHRLLWPDKPIEYVKVENDGEGYHSGVFHQNEIIAIISLFLRNAGIITARFRKFAVKPNFQHRGTGTGLLNHVMGEAARRDTFNLL